MRKLILAALLTLSVTQAQAALNSPARLKAFAKLPDWSGIWLQNTIKTDVNGQTFKDSPRPKFFGPPPYNPTWEAAYKARIAAMGTVPQKGCIIDFPATMESPQTFELIVTPEETVFTSGDGTFRHIYTDGRGHPPKDELLPTITGHSIGHWEGETLVVDTVARTPGPDRFLRLAAYSAEARFSERIRMTGKDTMEDQMTIDDPVAFIHPWTLTLTYERVTFYDRFDPYYCELDDRIDIKDGKETIAPAK